MCRLQLRSMKDVVDAPAVRKTQPVGLGGHNINHLKWSSPLCSQLPAAQPQREIPSGQPNLITLLEGDITPVGVGQTLHALLALLQRCSYLVLNTTTSRNCIHYTK